MSSERAGWTADAVQVGTLVVIGDSGIRGGNNIYRIARVTPTQAVTENDRYRLDRATGAIRGAAKWGPYRARIATDADVAEVAARRRREAVRATEWQKVPDEMIATIYAMLNGGAP